MNQENIPQGCGEVVILQGHLEEQWRDLTIDRVREREGRKVMPGYMVVPLTEQETQRRNTFRMFSTE